MTAYLYPEAVSDCLIIEGSEDASRDERLAAWGRIIAHNLHRVLQGSVGRQAESLIAGGIITPEGEVLG